MKTQLSGPARSLPLWLTVSPSRTTPGATTEITVPRSLPVISPGPTTRTLLSTTSGPSKTPAGTTMVSPSWAAAMACCTLSPARPTTQRAPSAVGPAVTAVTKPSAASRRIMRRAPFCA